MLHDIRWIGSCIYGSVASKTSAEKTAIFKLKELCMSRTFYSYAIFFSGIYILTSLIYSIAYLQLGSRLIEVPSLRQWMILMTAITVVWSLILLKYYYQKQYSIAFSILVVTTTATLVHFVFYYQALSTHELSIGFFIGMAVVLVANLAHGICLIFSRASERPWMKIAGVLIVILEVVMIASIIWALVSVTARLTGSIDMIHKWVSLVSSLVPFFFILNFHEEYKTGQKNPQTDHSIGLIGLASISACIALFMFVPRFGKEAITLAGNFDYVSEWMKAPAKVFEARAYTNEKGNKLSYRLLQPLDYDSTKKYPLVLCLHGSSGCGSDNTKQILSSIHAYVLSQDSMRRKYPAFLLVPQCPVEHTWGGFPGVPSVDSLVVETMLTLQKEFAIDQGRCYVMGNSLGGYGAWHLAATRPQMFAAAVPICGGGDPTLARNMADMPVWAFHGAKDMNVPVSGSRDMIEALKLAGGDPRYTEFPDEAHGISRSVIETADLLDWMFAQRRD